MDPRRRPAAALALDLVLVAVFVAIGRAGHREDQSAYLWTLWPFAAGLLVGWAAARGWRAPVSVVRTGLPVWVATVAVGMGLRVLSGQGVQPAFVVVAAVVTALLLLGWRLVARLVGRRRR